MYLTGGHLKGQKIEVPNDVKPTLSKVRESIFNMLLQYDLSSNNFLDMFAGSAIMGLEALSRGFNVVELEKSVKTAQIIKNNYKKLKQAINLVVCNSLKYVSNDRYDVIYIDPPWQDDYLPIIEKACSLLNDKGVIIVEYDIQRNISIQDIVKESKINLEIVKSKKYGRCLIDILRKNN